MMKFFKQLTLAIAIIFCFSVAASAQTPEDKKPPRKKDPPVVIVKGDKDRDKDKDKSKDNEKKDNPGKKPQAFVIELENKAGITFV